MEVSERGLSLSIADAVQQTLKLRHPLPQPHYWHAHPLVQSFHVPRPGMQMAKEKYRFL